MAYHAPIDFAATAFDQWKVGVLGYLASQGTKLDYWLELDPEFYPCPPRGAFNSGWTPGRWGQAFLDLLDAAENPEPEYSRDEYYEAFLELQNDNRLGR